MLLYTDRSGRAPLLAAHVSDFDNLRAGSEWRRAAKRELAAGVPGLVFAKAMPFIGSRASGGFGAGVPDLRRQVLLTAWTHESEFYAFLSLPMIERLTAQRRSSWWGLFAVTSTRGSHYGLAPLAATAVGDGVFAALTLGRTRSRTLLRFLREGAGLRSSIQNAPGLITACSAGIPLTGNCTLSIWESEGHMLDFAYGDPGGHRGTARRDPPLLTEQLNARMRLRRLGGNWGSGTLHADRLSLLAKRLL